MDTHLFRLYHAMGSMLTGKYLVILGLDIAYNHALKNGFRGKAVTNLSLGIHRRHTGEAIDDFIREINNDGIIVVAAA
jgi:hypothetical protein